MQSSLIKKLNRYVLNIGILAITLMTTNAFATECESDCYVACGDTCHNSGGCSSSYPGCDTTTGTCPDAICVD